jgi:hypothetical protein
MPRIYTEIRIHHNSLEDKKEFEKEIDKQADETGVGSRAAYVKLIVKYDVFERLTAGTGIVKRLEDAEISIKVEGEK